jgi:biotin transport system ATP-binding protein
MRFREDGVGNIEVVKLSRITKRFRVEGGAFCALEDVSLSVALGDFVVIAGANGSGKSLLMAIIAGLESPTSGTVETSERVALVLQEPDAQILGETAREDIAFGPRNMGLSKDETRARVQEALRQTGLTDRADFPARSLSGGEKRRLAAAGVLAMGANIIIFDDPYANMDYPGAALVNRLLEQLKADGKTIIILTHEIEKCLALASRFIVLFAGKKVFDGTPAQALESDLEAWGIHHPLRKAARELGDLLW